MSEHEYEKRIQKKLAQITVFQVILVLSLPSYAQIIKQTETNQILTWMGFSAIMATIVGAYFYKQNLKKSLIVVKNDDQKSQKNRSAS